MIDRILNIRTVALLGFYLVVAAVSYFAAYEVRFDFSVPNNYNLDRLDTAWWAVGLKLMLLIGFGQLTCILSYFRLPDALRLGAALAVSAAILFSMWYVYGGDGVPPRAVILVDFLISFLAIGSFRVGMRMKASRSLTDWFSGDAWENILIVGAGEVGAGLCSDLMSKSSLGMRPMAFLDDDHQKIGRYVHGVLVAGAIEELAAVANKYDATKVVIAFPSASVKRVKDVTDCAREVGLAVEIVPALTDLVSGRAEISQLRPIDLEDFLGRDSVELHSENIRAMLVGKRVLITGAGGSIGSELVRQVIGFAPASMHCLDQAEIAVFNLQQAVASNPKSSDSKISYSVTDIGDGESVRPIFDSFKPEVVFHAAAHKHVNLMENQPAEALRNNFFATASLARVASESGVERFVFISSDKAINPTNVMGASKRLAELALLEENAAPENSTKFISVRFGNVLGSSGSVIPIFRRQISEGGPITVTDPDVTRFFMTVEEAVGLVLESATHGEGGEIFVLNMGESIKIVDVARQMIGLSGLREGIDIDIEYVGLRPGEKLFEEVQHLSEELCATSHPRVLRFVAVARSSQNIKAMTDSLLSVIASGEPTKIKQSIQELVPEYTPFVEGGRLRSDD
ncbi:polysaccharide biosynthesis protein [bacterium]|nr:polysaccharide biosynthesis protein [bacterium]